MTQKTQRRISTAAIYVVGGQREKFATLRLCVQNSLSFFLGVSAVKFGWRLCHVSFFAKALTGALTP